jgi:hypothetical protein
VSEKILRDGGEQPWKRSSDYVPDEHACKNLQAIPELASTFGFALSRKLPLAILGKLLSEGVMQGDWRG